MPMAHNNIPSNLNYVKSRRNPKSVSIKSISICKNNGINFSK
uniref:Uncharacterized protein n=1 Tax=Manihot esculenta TaxID=3983 RepID=A0A199U9R1_MANES